jgi:GrpB-like predicted nucleotidyltransferase (UPF0157 family)
MAICEYDPGWLDLFLSERDRVQRALGEVASRIEHFGSTAVPGMAGKPIVDLLVGVADLRSASRRLSVLGALGYENFGEIFIPGRIYLRRRGPPHFNLAVTEVGGPFWRDQLIIRDFLRAHPDEAAAYSAHKRSIFAEGSRLFSNYSQAKGPFLAKLKERAVQWNAARSG